MYLIPSLHSLLRFYHLDSGFYVLVGLVGGVLFAGPLYHLDSGFYVLIGLVGGVLFAGPLVVWFVRRRKFASLAESIYWECSNRIVGWASLAGFVSGIAYWLAKSMLAGRSYQA
jgi:hypothetical protein